MSVFSSSALQKPADPLKTATKKNWPDEGVAVVMVEKCVVRDAGVTAVLCSHPTAGRQWVSFDYDQLTPVRVGKTMELKWRWLPEGHYSCVIATEAPRLADYKGEIPLS